MSTVEIPDDILNQAGITSQEAILELACRLYDTGRLTLFFAAKLAGLSTNAFEDVLLKKKIPIYRFEQADLRNDLKTHRQAGT